MNEKQRAVIKRLQAGEVIINYSECGNSMVPKIYSREPVTLEPVDRTKLERGDMVLVKVNGKVYTHLITALSNDQFQIGNNHGGINGWTKKENVYGIVTEVNGRIIGSARSKVKVKENK